MCVTNIGLLWYVLLQRTNSTADNGGSNVADIFDGNVGQWRTAKLSVARWDLSATSLPSQGLALFAGGGCAYWLLGCVMSARVPNRPFFLKC